MDRKDKKKAFKADEGAIGKILNEWNPIPSPCADEYDCLNHKIVGALHKGATRPEIERLIAQDLADHFGLTEDRDVIKSVARDIMDHWSTKP